MKTLAVLSISTLLLISLIGGTLSHGIGSFEGLNPQQEHQAKHFCACKVTTTAPNGGTIRDLKLCANSCNSGTCPFTATVKVISGTSGLAPTSAEATCVTNFPGGLAPCVGPCSLNATLPSSSDDDEPTVFRIPGTLGSTPDAANPHFPDCSCAVPQGTTSSNSAPDGTTLVTTTPISVTTCLSFPGKFGQD